MRCEVFEHQPGRGDYGSDWRRLYSLATKADAIHCAKLAFNRDSIPLRVFTARKSGIGKLLAEFGGNKHCGYCGYGDCEKPDADYTVCPRMHAPVGGAA